MDSRKKEKTEHKQSGFFILNVQGRPKAGPLCFTRFTDCRPNLRSAPNLAQIKAILFVTFFVAYTVFTVTINSQPTVDETCDMFSDR